ncbi:MAG: hypothetical protein AB8G23_01160 [Myxococcota bacterium]
MSTEPFHWIWEGRCMNYFTEGDFGVGITLLSVPAADARARRG